MKKFYLFLISFLVVTNSYAVVWETESDGYWNQSITWKEGNIPPYISADTILIKHNIITEQNITLNNKGLIIIYDTSGLCGHRKMSINTGAVVRNRGILKLDSLLVSGGEFGENKGTVLVKYAKISNGGFAYQYGLGSFTVRKWHECGGSELTTTQLKVQYSNITITPIPSNDVIEISSVGNSLYAHILNSTGIIVAQHSLEKEITRINIRSLHNGIYTLLFLDENSSFIAAKKFIVQH